jgi:drug/metabolite transporter (DMT)-like permease
MFKKKLTLKILSVLIFSDLLETFTQFCFKKSTFSQSEFYITGLLDSVVFLKGVFSSPFLWVGLLSVALTFIIWSTILSKIDLSVAVPIASFSYILVPLVSIIFLHEKISALRWLGIFFILAGVIFVSLSSREKEANLE